jgi:hypothetical protein
LYSKRNGQLHGSLDGSAHSCEEHLPVFLDVIRAAGFTAFVLPGTNRAAGTRCGSGADYTGPALRTIAAPVAAPASAVAVLLAGATPEPGHPAWCTRGAVCTEDFAHTSKPLLANLHRGAEFAAVRVWLEQLHDDLALPTIRLELTEEGEPADYQMPLHQAELLAQQMIALVVTAGGAR